MNPIIDLHQDLMLYVSRPDLYQDRAQTSFGKLKTNNVKLVIASAFPVPPDGDYGNPIANKLIEQDFKKYLDYVHEHPEFVIVKNKDDVDRVMATEDLFGIVLHVEGLNVFDEQGGWSMLERWHRLGLRSLGPMWNVNNPFGGGTLDSDRGLTDLGRQLIGWCERKGVILDFAHMNAPTFADAAAVVSRPIFVSHGNVQAICPSSRNYSDDQLRKIGETGGVIGVFLSKKFLSGEKDATLATVVDHVNHVAKIAGENTIAIGSDFGGIVSGFADGLTSLDQIHRLVESVDQKLRKKLCSENAMRVLGQFLL